MAEQRGFGPEAVANMLESLRGKGRITFCGGIAILLVQVPPRWQAWISGELSTGQEWVWIGAMTTIVAGIVALGYKLAGKKVPEQVQETLGEGEEK